MTDVELVELRYGGKPAAFLRGFRSIYIAFLVNSIIVGWVTAAMLNVLKFTVFSGTEAATGASDWFIILALFAIVGLYSTLSGLWGVVITDFLQFIVPMLMPRFPKLSHPGLEHALSWMALITQVYRVDKSAVSLMISCA